MASLDDETEREFDPNKEMVRLISKEGHEFIASRECCMASGTIRTLLTGPGNWKETEGSSMPTIHFEEISTSVLEKVLQYFYYKHKYDHTPPPLPAFKIDVESIVPILLAANFLDT